MRLTPLSNRILKVYGLLPDTEREKLARVRRLRKDGTINHPGVISAAPRRNPNELGESIERLRPIAAQHRELYRMIFKAAERATFDSRSDKSALILTDIQKCADLELQAVLWAIELRERGQLPQEEFDIWTRAWREVGLPL